MSRSCVHLLPPGERSPSDEALVYSGPRDVRDLIHPERAKPSWIVSHELSLNDAPDTYKNFDARNNGWTKVVLHPA